MEVEFVKDEKEPKYSKEPKVLKLSANAKKIFLGKIKSFLKRKNNNILETNKDVYDYECLNDKSILPATTIVRKSINMKHSRDYFPSNKN